MSKKVKYVDAIENLFLSHNYLIIENTAVVINFFFKFCNNSQILIGNNEGTSISEFFLLISLQRIFVPSADRHTTCVITAKSCEI